MWKNLKFLVLVLVHLHSIANLCNGRTITSNYTRKLWASTDMPTDAFPRPLGDNAPEQVHISTFFHCNCLIQLIIIFTNQDTEEFDYEKIPVIVLFERI